MPHTRNENIHRIWDDLTDSDLSQSEAALDQLMTRLAGLGELGNVTWAGAIRMDAPPEGDPLQGWRVAAMRSLQQIPPCESEAPPRENDAHFKDILNIWERREIDPSFLLPLREVGRFRTYSFRRELPAAWFESPFYHHHYRTRGGHRQ